MSYGQQCAYYGQTYYDWEGMNNSIDNRNPYANAELQYHCAVSVNMNFSPDGSGSYSYLVPGSLSSYFRYNPLQYKEKQNYTLANWITLLKTDIDQGYPVYYSGYNPTRADMHSCATVTRATISTSTSDGAEAGTVIIPCRMSVVSTRARPA